MTSDKISTNRDESDSFPVLILSPMEAVRRVTTTQIVRYHFTLLEQAQSRSQSNKARLLLAAIHSIFNSAYMILENSTDTTPRP